MSLGSESVGGEIRQKQALMRDKISEAEATSKFGWRPSHSGASVMGTPRRPAKSSQVEIYSSPPKIFVRGDLPFRPRAPPLQPFPRLASTSQPPSPLQDTYRWAIHTHTEKMAEEHYDGAVGIDLGEF
jgi:hypothetical protein